MHRDILSRRRVLIALFCVAAGCGQQKPATLPATVRALGGEFRQAGPPGAALDLHADWRNMAIRKGAAASYSGGGRTVSVEVWEFKTPANAFEAIQRWRAQQGMTAFQREGAVVVCAGQEFGQDDLLQFSKALQDQMGSSK